MVARGPAAAAAAWLWLAALANDGASAIRLSEASDLDDAVEEILKTHGSMHTDSEVWNALTPEQKETMQNVTDAIDRGRAVEATLTCEKLRQYMPAPISHLTSALHPACSAETCKFTHTNLEEVLTGQQMITTLAAAADKKKCLDEVVGTQEAQANLKEFLSFVPKLLQSAPSAEGSARMQEAYLQLVSFQEGAQELAKGMADRKSLLRTDIDFGSECPSPCGKCEKAGAFGFTCFLKTADKDSTLDFFGHSVDCQEPRRRHVLSWLMTGRKYSRVCTVPDWKESAVQHVHVGAVVSCTAESILLSLNGELSSVQRREVFTICLAVEQGNAVSDAVKQQYKAHAQVMDGVIPRGLGLAINAVLTVGLASGLAGVRAATRGNGLPVLLEVGDVDFVAPFSRHLGELAVRAEDRAMYGDREQVRRTETLNRLGACEEVYSMQMQDTFLEGSKMLTVHSMGLVQDEQEKGTVRPASFMSVNPSAGQSFGSGDPFGKPSPVDDSEDDGEHNFKPLPGYPEPAPADGPAPWPAPAPGQGNETRKVKWAGGTFLGYFGTFSVSSILSTVWLSIVFQMFLGIVAVAAPSAIGPVNVGMIIFGLIFSYLAFVAGTIGIFYGIGLLVGHLTTARSAELIEKCMRDAEVDAVALLQQ